MKEPSAEKKKNGMEILENHQNQIVIGRRLKDNVETVNEGLECGIGLVDYKDIKEGDVIEVLGEVEI